MTNDELAAELDWLIDEADSLSREVALEHGSGEPLEDLSRIAAVRAELAARGLMVAE